jgi:hypothetical protein
MAAFASPYIKTVAAQVTRLADSAVMTGVNFSSWYNPSEGALFADALAPLATGVNHRFAFSDNTLNNRIVSVVGTPSLLVSVGGVSQVSMTSSETANVYQKYAASYKVNDFAVTVSAATPTTDVSGTLPIVDRFYIGASAVGTTSFLNGYIKRLTYYPQALTSANLTAVTR